MSATRLTKTGQPVMGTRIEVRLSDGTYEGCAVTGKGYGKDGHTLACAWVRWDDGAVQFLDWSDVIWRSVGTEPSDEAEATALLEWGQGRRP